MEKVQEKTVVSGLQILYNRKKQSPHMLRKFKLRRKILFCNSSLIDKTLLFCYYGITQREEM